ncbi:MAG: hypothetical protein WDM96_13080 [Lacunisphaera sp.]
MGRVAQQHAEAGHGGGELEILARLLKAGAGVAQREVQLVALVRRRLLVADVHRQQLATGGVVSPPLSSFSFVVADR